MGWRGKCRLVVSNYILDYDARSIHEQDAGLRFSNKQKGIGS